MPQSKAEQRRREEWVRMDRERQRKKAAARAPAPARPATIVNGKIIPQD